MNDKAPVHVKKMINAIKELGDNIKEQSDRLQTIKKQYIQVEKTMNTFISYYNNNYNKPRKPRGFEIPVNITPVLCDFIGVPHDTKIARIAVTRQIINYIKQNELYDKENKTHVLPDDKLMILLGDDVDYEHLTRFTIQKYMNKHFISNKL
jgi:chromatin remodeling complex protein RSC6